MKKLLLIIPLLILTACGGAELRFQEYSYANSTTCDNQQIVIYLKQILLAEEVLVVNVTELGNSLEWYFSRSNPNDEDVVTVRHNFTKYVRSEVDYKNSIRQLGECAP